MQCRTIAGNATGGQNGEHEAFFDGLAIGGKDPAAPEREPRLREVLGRIKRLVLDEDLDELAAVRLVYYPLRRWRALRRRWPGLVPWLGQARERQVERVEASLYRVAQSERRDAVSAAKLWLEANAPERYQGRSAGERVRELLRGPAEIVIRVEQAMAMNRATERFENEARSLLAARRERLALCQGEESASG